MDPITIFIPGQPLGKERARSRIITGRDGRQFTSHYTPAKTRRNEGVISSYAIGAMAGRRPLAGPVRLELMMGFQVPKSWPAWKVELALARRLLPTVKPDSDNIEKSIKDGFNGVIWVDDCQVVECTKVKVYAAKPGIVATITALGQYPAQITRRDIDHDESQSQTDLLSA